MADRPNLTLPKDFVLAREADPATILPRKNVGTYLAARTYAALRSKDGEGQFVGHDGASVKPPYGFEPLDAPIGASVKVQGRYWSEDRDGSFFKSASPQLALKPATVKFSTSLYMGNSGIRKRVEQMRAAEPGFSYGSLIPTSVLDQVETWLDKSDDYKDRLQEQLENEDGEQIGSKAKSLYESAATYRAAAMELLEFAHLRAVQLQGSGLTCAPDQALDFMEGKCSKPKKQGSSGSKGSKKDGGKGGGASTGATSKASGGSAKTPKRVRDLIRKAEQKGAGLSGAAIAGIVVGTAVVLGAAATVVYRRSLKASGART